MNVATVAIGAAATEAIDTYASSKYSASSFVSGNLYGIKYPHLIEAIIGFVLPFVSKNKMVKDLGYGIGSAGIANVAADLVNKTEGTAVYDPASTPVRTYDIGIMRY
jgi:hypothetical protein